MKKVYKKPKAEWVSFQIDEAIMSGVNGTSEGGLIPDAEDNNWTIVSNSGSASSD